MTAVKLRLAGALLALAAVGAAMFALGLFSGPDPQPIATGQAGKRQPAPSTSDGTYLYVTVSWEQGRTAAVSITAGGRPVSPAEWVAEGGGRLSYCDTVCTESPTEFSIQVRRGDLVILSVVATARAGRVFCSLRRVGEDKQQLVKPAKNTGLEGEVVCKQTAR